LEVLVTGGNGYIAKSLATALGSKYNITPVTRNDFDLTDTRATCAWLKDKYFDVVLHTAIVGGSRLDQDTHDVVDQNLLMYYNLLGNRESYGKFINFGSGAEQFQPHSPYGSSKKIIADSVANTENFYNIRIFGIFDENELDRRFILSNMIRYINKEPMVIHENRMMDFFYMKDLVSVVEYYIEQSQLSKQVNCCYNEKYTLYAIAQMINQLGDYEVPIEVPSKSVSSYYCGESILPPINTIGLKSGILNMFEQLQKGYSYYE
jgi:nucleoside-diphosphate-sugar epimerase